MSNKKGYYCSYHNRTVTRQEYSVKCRKGRGNGRNYCTYLINFKLKGGLESKLEKLNSSSNS